MRAQAYVEALGGQLKNNDVDGGLKREEGSQTGLIRSNGTYGRGEKKRKKKERKEKVIKSIYTSYSYKA